MIYYENSRNEKVILDDWPLILQNPEALREYKWEITSAAAKRTYIISSIYKKVESKTIEVAVFADSEAEFNDTLNRMYDIFEYDVKNEVAGKIYWGNQYLKCFILSSKFDDYEEDMYSTDINLTIESDHPFWIKETDHRFHKENSSEGGTGLDYPHDYPFDYKRTSAGEHLVNDHFAPTDFIMTIYGPCDNPSIYIADHLYNVNVKIGERERLVIDSRAEKINESILLYGTYGDTTNCFGKRSLYSSVFEKIPAGESIVSWSKTFDFDLKLLNERSEPKW